MVFKLLNDFLQTSIEERIEVLYLYLVKGESSGFIAENYYKNKNYAWKISAITQGYSESKGMNRGKVSTTKDNIKNFIETYPKGTYDKGLTLSEWIENSGTKPFFISEFMELENEHQKMVEERVKKHEQERIKKIFSKFHNTPFKIKYKRPITLVSGTTHDTYNQMLSEMFPNRTVIYELDGFYNVKYQYNCGVKVFFYPDFLYIIEKPYFGNLFNGKEYVEGVSRDWTLFDKLIMYKDINKVHGSYASVHNETKFSTSEWAYSDTYEVTHFYLGEVGEVFSTYRNDDETKKIISTINNIIKTYKGE